MDHIALAQGLRLELAGAIEAVEDDERRRLLIAADEDLRIWLEAMRAPDNIIARAMAALYDARGDQSET